MALETIQMWEINGEEARDWWKSIERQTSECIEIESLSGAIYYYGDESEDNLNEYRVWQREPTTNAAIIICG